MANQENFANSVAEQLPYLTRFVRRLTWYDANVEDIVRQTVLKALIHVDQFRFQSTLKTWLTSIAHNEDRQSHRSKWQASTEGFADNFEGYRSLRESDARALLITRRSANSF